MGGYLGKLSKIKDSLKEHVEMYFELGCLGSLGSLSAYATTQIEQFELSLVGEVVGGPACVRIGVSWGGGFVCGEFPRRIITLAEAMERIQFDYSLVGIALGLTVLGTYFVAKDRLRNKRGELR